MAEAYSVDFLLKRHKKSISLNLLTLFPLRGARNENLVESLLPIFNFECGCHMRKHTHKKSILKF